MIEERKIRLTRVKGGPVQEEPKNRPPLVGSKREEGGKPRALETISMIGNRSALSQIARSDLVVVNTV